MLVDPSQLVPGCVLLKEVYSKTNQPIIPKNTILTELHIKILSAFLVKTVEVGTNLSNGENFEPIKKILDKELAEPKKESHSKKASIQPFQTHFQEVVKAYTLLFQSFKSGMPIDILKVRNLIIPLLERENDIDQVVTSLHHYGNKRNYLFYHSVAVAILSSFLARKLGYEKGEWLQIGIAGLLSDCGMSKMNPMIVFKNGPLHKSEFEEVKKHPTYSYRLVEHMKALTGGVKLAILQHHERLDGSGYPLGVPMGKIHRYAKIIAVCDTYHAMVSTRLYKEGKSPYKVIEEIQKNQYTKFDANMVSVFSKCLANFKKGTKVRLSNKQTAEVIFVEPTNPTRPIVRLDNSNDIISLENKLDLYVETCL